VSKFKQFTGFLVLLAGVGMGYLDTAFGQANPISVSPQSLTFTAQTGGAAPASQTLVVTSATPGVNFFSNATVGPNSPTVWLRVEQSTTQTPGNVLVSVSPANLPAGTYLGQVTIASGTGFVTIGVTFNVTPPSPLTASPAALTFTHTIGAAPPAQQLITITAAAATAYSASAATQNSVNWLLITPTTGTTTGSIGVSIDATNLVAGDYEGTITVTPSGQNPAPVTISVKLTVSAAPTLTANPASLTFNYQIGGSVPPAQTLQVTSSNPVLGFTVASNVQWLIVNTASAATPANLTITLSPGQLQTAGTFQGQITLTPFGAPAITVPVTVNVGTSPFIAPSPNVLNFKYQLGSTTLPQDQAVTVSSTGVPLSFTTSVTQEGGNWLRVRTINPTTTQPLVIGVETAGLPAGTYRGTVVLNNQGQAGTPPSISITLTVSNDPVLLLSVQSANFAYQVGKTAPNAVAVGVSSTGAPLNYSATASGGNWLVLTNQTGSSGGFFTIGVNISGLQPNTYEGTVTVTVPNSENTPITIPVRLVVSNNPLLVLGSNSVSFKVPVGTTTPQISNVSVTSTDTSLTFTTSVNTNGGGGWLTTFPQGGATTPANLGVTVNPAGLAAGTYTGSIDIASQNVPNSPQRITVSLVVAPNETLAASPAQLTFTQVIGGAAAADQSVTISANSIIPFSASTITSNGGNWLSVTPTGGNTTSAIAVKVNAATLSAGQYTGEVLIQSQQAANTVRVPVTLNVTAQRTLTLTPKELAFTAAANGPAPATQELAVTSTGGAINFAVSVSTDPIGGAWISVAPLVGATSGRLTVAVNPLGVQPGIYRATITVTAEGASNSPQTVTVTFTVTGTTISMTPESLTFNYQIGGPAPAAQQVNLGVQGPAVNFTAASTTDGGGPWLSAAPLNGAIPAALTVSVNPQGLGAGTYTGNVTITAPGAANSPRTLRVTFVIAAPTTVPSIREVLHGATFQAVELAAGLIFTIKGSNLGPAQGQLFSVVDGRVPTTLAGARVLLDNIPAPVLYAQADQINAIVPYSMANRSGANLVVEYFGARSSTIQVRIGSASPGLFTVPATGAGQGAILNQNTSPNSASNPANKGDVVVIYATGEGQTTPGGVDGLVNATSFPKPVQQVRVFFGSVESPDVRYAGAAPTFVSGVLQVNAVIPANAPSGNVPVVIQVGDQRSPAVATVAVR
jgi:uncharacterized protein (TIGR03437 family)